MRRLIFTVLKCCLLVLSIGNADAFKLPDTGQMLCYAADGSTISCAGSWQDGAYTINPMSCKDNSNGTITDNNTAFMWQKCSAGQNYLTCSGTASNHNWYQATGTVDATYNPLGGSFQDVWGSLNTSNFGGHKDWRLPTRKELVSIVDYSVPETAPTINPTYIFPIRKGASIGYLLCTTRGL